MGRIIPYVMDMQRVMYFIDGENLAIRFGALLLQSGSTPADHVVYERNALVWSPLLNEDGHGVMRKYYYTAVSGDSDKIRDAEAKLKAAGIEAPRVFHKSKKKGSKRVDVSLSTDMLIHATRRHFDIAVLVAGDEDYVPLVKAVQGEGARVHVWFVDNGVSPDLQGAADSFVDISRYLAKEPAIADA